MNGRFRPARLPLSPIDPCNVKVSVIETEKLRLLKPQEGQGLRLSGEILGDSSSSFPQLAQVGLDIVAVPISFS